LFSSPLFSSEASVWSFPNVLFFLVGGASPLLAGVTLAALTGGKTRLRELGWQLADVHRIGFGWLAIILVFWPAFDLLMAGAAVALGVTDRPLDVVWEIVTAPRSLAFMLLLSLVFPAVEEIGLRGYWLDELQGRFGPTIAGLVNGATWAPWDAFVSVADPDGLAQEFTSRGVRFHKAIQDTDDGLRGFEMRDSDGYVLFFGRPR
jgi:membrane protease YdiL (CAAX protease family)